MSLLEARDIFKAGGSRWILDGVSLSLEAGELLHLRGANGAGKSTLLRIIAGEIAPSSGKVEVKGLPLGEGPFQGRQHVSLLPERLEPSPWLTVEEYLEFRAALRGLDFDTGLLDDWELTPFSRRPMATLSQGERRRVVLAAAMLPAVDILLLDEPTVGLDERHRKRLFERIDEYRRYGRGVIIASHLDRRGLPAFDKVVTLSEGRVENAREGDEAGTPGSGEDGRTWDQAVGGEPDGQRGLEQELADNEASAPDREDGGQ